MGAGPWAYDPPRCRSLGRLAAGLRLGAFGGFGKLREGDLAGPYGSGGLPSPPGPQQGVCSRPPRDRFLF